uniref:Reverse transcriptase domain-containing protein n=1 Tax=Micrurus paraensis TaxID=1970185 RepID=A0A2D4JT22_9SAUR
MYVDYKIFSTIMAVRLKIVLNEIIHPDQNGFLPARQIRNNTRMVLDILKYYEAHPGKQMVLIFLDAQKAFGNLNWQFLIQQTKSMRFGTRLEKIISTIYATQKARVMVNGDCTKIFGIKKE